MAQNTAPTMSNGIGSPGKSSAVQSTGKIGNSQLGSRYIICHGETSVRIL